jgi:RND family efflux transporter MFP subunit
MRGQYCKTGKPLLPGLLCCSAATLLLGLAACSRGPEAGDGKGTAGETVAEVTVVKVALGEISESLSVSGTIAAVPNQDVRVSSLVPGRVAQMMVAEGDHVEKDQVLAKIDDRLLQDQLRQAEGAVEQARATFENAKLNRARNETLFERGIAARKDLEDSRTQQTVAEAALRQSEAARALSRLQLARTEIRSPLSGTLVKRMVSVGEQVDGTAAQPIFQVANLAQVELFGSVPAVYLGRIRVGQSFPVSTDAFPEAKFTGRVVAISPAVDPATNLGLVRIQMANTAGKLRWGMFLMAQIPIETHSNALVVPRKAVYRDEKGDSQVYKVQGETATATDVKLGLETQDRVELLSGVAAGETLILEGGYGLGDKARIKVKP